MQTGKNIPLPDDLAKMLEKYRPDVYAIIKQYCTSVSIYNWGRRWAITFHGIPECEYYHFDQRFDEEDRGGPMCIIDETIDFLLSHERPDDAIPYTAFNVGDKVHIDAAMMHYYTGKNIYSESRRLKAHIAARDGFMATIGIMVNGGKIDRVDIDIDELRVFCPNCIWQEPEDLL